jgi:ParB family chromosome partitioning protein
MNSAVTNATEYRNLPLALLTESKTNPRRTFEDDSLKELAESIRSQGILSPLLVRPITEQGFEIVFGARRYRAAQMAEASTVPVRIKNLTDAEALEAQLIELSIVVKRFLPFVGALHVVDMSTTCRVCV